MKRSLALFATLFGLVLSSSAFANSVSLTSEFEHQNRYYFSGNGRSTFWAMMRDGFGNQIQTGEPWTATQTLFLSGIASSGAQTVPKTGYANLVLNTPLKGWPGCGPRALIVYSPVPEPGDLTLLGTGLIGLAAVVRRKFAPA